MKKFTPEQAVIIMGFTGVTTVPFPVFHADVEKRLNRPVFTHEFASKEFAKEIEEIYKEDFISLCLDS
jgi:hypothetical protein